MSPEKVREEKKVGPEDATRMAVAGADAIVTVYLLTFVVGVLGIVVACFFAASKGGAQ